MSITATPRCGYVTESKSLPCFTRVGRHGMRCGRHTPEALAACVTRLSDDVHRRLERREAYLRRQLARNTQQSAALESRRGDLLTELATIGRTLSKVEA